MVRTLVLAVVMLDLGGRGGGEEAGLAWSGDGFAICDF